MDEKSGSGLEIGCRYAGFFLLSRVTDSDQRHKGIPALKKVWIIFLINLFFIGIDSGANVSGVGCKVKLGPIFFTKCNKYGLSPKGIWAAGREDITCFILKKQLTTKDTKFTK